MFPTSLGFWLLSFWFHYKRITPPKKKKKKILTLSKCARTFQHVWKLGFISRVYLTQTIVASLTPKSQTLISKIQTPQYTHKNNGSLQWCEAHPLPRSSLSRLQFLPPIQGRHSTRSLSSIPLRFSNQFPNFFLSVCEKSLNFWFVGFVGFWILQIYETVCKGAYRNFNSGVCNPSRILGNYTSKNGNFNFCLLGFWEFGNVKIKMKIFEVWMNNTQYPIST